MSETRRTITVKLPVGWGRSLLVGVEAAVIGWLVPAIVGITVFWLLASNPWLREVGWEAGAAAGGNFWSLSLGGQAPLGTIDVGFWPLLWTLCQVLGFRGSFLVFRGVEKYAVFFAVPSFVFVVFVLVLASSDGSAWRTVLGALVVAGIASFWAYLDASRSNRNWGWGWDGAKLGLLWFLTVVMVSLLFAVGSWVMNKGSVDAELASLGDHTGPLDVVFAMFMPNVAGWAWSWIVGAGIIGPGGEIISHLHPRSGGFGLPFWSLIPDSVGPEYFYWVPTVLGLLVGGVTARKRRRTRGHKILSNLRVVVVASFAFLVALLAWLFLSGGSLGTGNLAYLGPNVWVAFGWTALKFLLPAVLIISLFHADTFDAVRAFVRGVRTKLSGEPDADPVIDQKQESHDDVSVEVPSVGPSARGLRAEHVPSQDDSSSPKPRAETRGLPRSGAGGDLALGSASDPGKGLAYGVPETSDE